MFGLGVVELELVVHRMILFEELLVHGERLVVRREVVELLFRLPEFLLSVAETGLALPELVRGVAERLFSVVEVSLDGVHLAVDDVSSIDDALPLPLLLDGVLEPFAHHLVVAGGLSEHLALVLDVLGHQCLLLHDALDGTSALPDPVVDGVEVVERVHALEFDLLASQGEILLVDLAVVLCGVFELCGSEFVLLIPFLHGRDDLELSLVVGNADEDVLLSFSDFSQFDGREASVATSLLCEDIFGDIVVAHVSVMIVFCLLRQSYGEKTKCPKLLWPKKGGGGAKRRTLKDPYKKLKKQVFMHLYYLYEHLPHFHYFICVFLPFTIYIPDPSRLCSVLISMFFLTRTPFVLYTETMSLLNDVFLIEVATELP